MARRRRLNPRSDTGIGAIARDRAAHPESRSQRGCAAKDQERQQVGKNDLRSAGPHAQRRYHIAGHVGAEICRCCLELGWLVRQRDSRAIRLTAAGRRGLLEVFGVEMADGRRWMSV